MRAQQQLPTAVGASLWQCIGPKTWLGDNMAGTCRVLEATTQQRVGIT